MGFSNSFCEEVLDILGNECAVRGCERVQRGEPDRQNRVSVHPINGDDSDERLSNALPVCQSCNIHIHRVDEPPYRYWHRQLPKEKRGTSQTDAAWDGEQLTPTEAEELRAELNKDPVSVKYKTNAPIYDSPTTVNE